MSMGRTHNYNYVCVAHRTSGRGISAPKCNVCGTEMICIGYRWRVPKKSDDKEWKVLANATKTGHFIAP